MSNEALTVTVSLKGFISNTTEANKMKNEEVVKSLETILMWLWRKVAEKTPSVTGYLSGSIKPSSITGTGINIQGSIGSPVAYALPVEMGRKPGKMPNVEAIKMWMKSKLKIDDNKTAFLISRAIMRNGIKPVSMFKNTLDEETDYINRMLNEAMARTIERWGHVTQ